MVYLTRKEHFNAAHRLYNPQWSEEKNAEVFGACANPYYHGHNFELEVTVKGRPNPETGCVIDLKELSQIIRREVTDKLDHRNLNLEIDFLKNKIPSCEVLIIEIWKILDKALKNTNTSARLHSLVLHETSRNIVSYFGEEIEKYA
ncbi:MAG: 6-carboxytetrahydropterin synthase [Microscillaceae bacterium]|nr:6-carboxytetrahydropterin synthase [Microscillaceae bacterium]MDW8460035.1 6-carboxytetrahydropterin synthase [Cytophagales bacterium]